MLAHRTRSRSVRPLRLRREAPALKFTQTRRRVLRARLLPTRAMALSEIDDGGLAFRTWRGRWSCSLLLVLIVVFLRIPNPHPRPASALRQAYGPEPLCARLLPFLFCARLYNVCASNA